MRKASVRLPLLVAVTLGTMWSARPAAAQCGSSLYGLNYILPVPGNPLQGERVTTQTGFNATSDSDAQSQKELIARDSQGRVRVERIVAAGKEVESHTVLICDPGTQTFTRMDTLNKAATVIREAKGLSLTSSEAPEFCTSLFRGNSANVTVEKLGHRTIQGVDSEGLRFTIPGPSLTVREQWCSKELGVMVSQFSSYAKTGAKEQAVLLKLERREPEAALFKIPADYTVSESVPAETNPPVRPKQPIL